MGTPLSYLYSSYLCPNRSLMYSNYTIEVGNNANVNIQVNKGNVNVNTADGDINLKSGKDIVMDAAQGIYMRANLFSAEIDTTWDEKVSGINTKTGEEINLN